MKFHYLLFLFLLLICSCTQCNEEDKIRLLDINIAVHPEEKNYSLDDTLWLSSNFSFQEDSIAIFPFDLIVKGAPVEFVLDDLEDTTSLFIAHKEQSSNIFFNYGCPLQKDTFDFKVGIKFNTAGVYSLQTQDNEYFHQSSASPCDSLAISYYFPFQTGIANYFFEVADGNLDLHFQAPQLLSEKLIINKKGFIFKVE